MQNPAVAVIQALEATSSKNEKEQIILDAYMRGERQFFLGAILANDKLISFGVAKVAEIMEDDGVPGTLTWNDFVALAEDLRYRRLTGHAARDAITAAAEKCDFTTWNTFYRRILLKDLKIGAERTINKILGRIAAKTDPAAKDLMVPVFSPQLARDGADEANHKHLVGKQFLDLKLDGVRLVTELNKETGVVTQYTRDGAINDNFPHIREALAKVIPHLPGSIMLDGEMVARSFGELMEQLNRKSDGKKNTKKMKLALFDLVPAADFHDGFSPMTQRERHQTLCALALARFFKEAVSNPDGIYDEPAGIEDPMVYVLPKTEVDLDTEEGQDTLAQMRSTVQSEKEGGKAVNEGVMVKQCEAPYQNGWDPVKLKMENRPIYWLKLKPTISVSLTVTGVEQGKPDGKYAHTLGGLVCEGTSDCGKPIKVTCGGGLKNAQRDEWWADPSKIIGYIVEIEADEGFSKSKTNDHYSLRFPRLKGLRGTVPGEKL